MRVHTDSSLHVLAGLLETNQKLLRLVVGVSTKRYALMLVRQEESTDEGENFIGSTYEHSVKFCPCPRCDAARAAAQFDGSGGAGTMGP